MSDGTISTLAQWFHIATMVLMVLLTILAAQVILTIRKLSKDTEAAQRLRKQLMLAAATAAALGIVFVIPKVFEQSYIEPVGGVDVISDSRPRQDRNSPSFPPFSSPDQTTQQDAETGRGEPLRQPAKQTPEQTDQNNTAPAETTAWTQGSGPLASALRTQRVIVHTADAELVVKNIPEAINLIEQVAARHQGWVVSSSQDSNHNGAISLRVPAPSLQAALDDIKSVSVKTNALNLSSTDVTDEYVDIQSRLRALEATELNYLELLTKAQNLTENLDVRELLQVVQTDIEQHKGRLKYLAEVSSFSLITINLSLAPLQMDIDAGEDIIVQVGQQVSLDSILASPSGAEEFSYTWDFGDGSNIQTGRQTALLVGGGGRRITNPAKHVYESEGRYIIQVKARTTGEYGVAEGADTLLATVKAVPTIAVSVPINDSVVTEGKEFQITASFTKPAELQQYTYQWYFGDGTPSQSGQVPDGSNQVTGTHTYNHPTRGQSHKGQFTISALSQAGKVSSSTKFNVYVQENKPIIAGNWDVSNWFKGAVRAVFATLSVLMLIGVWLLIFSPLIAIVVAAVLLMWRKGWILSG